MQGGVNQGGKNEKEVFFSFLFFFFFYQSVTPRPQTRAWVPPSKAYDFPFPFFFPSIIPPPPTTTNHHHHHHHHTHTCPWSVLCTLREKEIFFFFFLKTEEKKTPTYIPGCTYAHTIPRGYHTCRIVAEQDRAVQPSSPGVGAARWRRGGGGLTEVPSSMYMHIYIPRLVLTCTLPHSGRRKNKKNTSYCVAGSSSACTLWTQPSLLRFGRGGGDYAQAWYIWTVARI